MGSSTEAGSLGRGNAAIGVTGAAVGVLTLALTPFLSYRPNRIVSGDTLSAVEAFGIWGWLAVALWAGTGLLAVISHRPGRRRATLAVGVGRGLLVAAVVVLLLALAGYRSAEFAQGGAAAARTSFSWGFYLFVFALYLSLHSAAAGAPAWPARLAVWVMPLVGVAVLGATGVLDDLGIVREWTATRDTFGRELVRHLFYALGATAGAVVVGIPLGVLAARRRRAEAGIMAVLNIGQVLPALAFVGIMIPILGGLSDRLSPLKAVGISGIGWAPVMIVLLVYALYPVTRNTTVAIRSLDPAVVDSASGMGMSRRRLLWEVEFPLALPVVLAGVRVALVQSTAGAIIAAFVGGGGLGTIMFIGLEQTSMDLVLVGVIPIAVLALLFDTLLRAIERTASAGRGSQAEGALT